MTRPNTPPFVPPPPYSQDAPGSSVFGYGSNALWTYLPLDGSWTALPTTSDGYLGQKIFLWSTNYDVSTEPFPALTITGKRLDGDAPPLEVDRATNAYGQMLVGVNFPTSGCWQITSTYKGHVPELRRVGSRLPRRTSSTRHPDRCPRRHPPQPQRLAPMV